MVLVGKMKDVVALESEQKRFCRTLPGIEDYR